MKNQPFAPVLMFVSMALTMNCQALTPVEDNFNKGLNKLVWQLAEFENARLRTSKERLNFYVHPPTAGGFPEEDYAYIELLNNQPGINESWQLVIDVTNTIGEGDSAGIGFWIFNADDHGDVIFFEFYGNSGKRRKLCADASFVLDGVTSQLPSLEFKAAKLTSAKLRVTYSKKTKLFTFHIGKMVPKSDGKGTKLEWTSLGTFSPTGEGGDVRANWNLNPGSGRFGIRLEGYAEGLVVENGQARLDNFVLKALK